jgi:hypothetical protein
VFTVNNGLGNSDFFIKVRGVKMPVIVDSGTSVNVIDKWVSLIENCSISQYPQSISDISV